MKPFAHHTVALAVCLAAAGCSTYKPLDGGSDVPWARAIAAPPAKPAPPGGLEVTRNRERLGVQPVRTADMPAADLSGRVHRVARGEMLSLIAERYDVRVAALAGANGLASPYRIYPGQVLRVPGSVDVRPAAAPPARHVVRRGENLSVIARRHGVSVGSIVRANDLRSPDALRVGQSLLLPGAIETVVASRDDGARTIAAAVPATVPDDRFIWPLKGKVIAGFGRKEDGEINHGISIAARPGTPVRAARNGEVIYAGDAIRGYGRMILIRHGSDYVTTYAHNAVLLVNVGDRVERGQVIARVGETGGVSRPQLHFELRKGRKPLDPKGYLVDLPTTVASSG